MDRSVDLSVLLDLGLSLVLEADTVGSRQLLVVFGCSRGLDRDVALVGEGVLLDVGARLALEYVFDLGDLLGLVAANVLLHHMQLTKPDAVNGLSEQREEGGWEEHCLVHGRVEGCLDPLDDGGQGDLEPARRHDIR